MTPLTLAALIAVPTLAVLVVLGWWLARRRVRPLSTAERVRAIPADQWQDRALGVVAESVQRQPTQESGMHEHMRDAAGYCQTCDAGPRSDLPEPNLDVIAESDHRRAEHLNRTLRRAEGGDEHGC